MAEPARARIPTLQKMVDLLQVFTPDRPRVRWDHLARDLSWDGATTHRFLKALTELRMLELNEDGSYSLGTLPVQLATVYMSTKPQRRELLARLEELSHETELTTQIGILDGDRVAIVASQEGRSAVKAAAMLGERLPLHATAGGKAILAGLSDTEIAGLLPTTLERLTPNTLPSRAQLMAAVEQTRRSGLARAESELSHGLLAIAIPLPAGYFDARPAALTCAGPEMSADSNVWEHAEEVLRQEHKRIQAIASRMRLVRHTAAGGLRSESAEEVSIQ
jgi:IclR family transcriptional regulator, KDG regulon repressor